MKQKKWWCALLAAAVLVTGISASASNITSVQNQKTQNEKELKKIQSQINSLENQKSALSTELSNLNDELVSILLNIEILESDLADKEVQIEEAQEDFEEAKATEENHFGAMKLRIQYLYENGNKNYIEMFLTSDSMADLINRVDYAEELQEYDKRLLDEYKAVKEAVIELQRQLDEEKEELLMIQEQLAEEKANLEVVISQKKSELEDFSSQLNAAKTKASQYQKKIKEQNAQIKKLQQQEAAARAAQNVGGGGSKGSSSGTASVSGGTGLGGSIASYGLQFVGRPYVSGGNSLTNGTDCSGFVHLVYAHFGLSVPRQSSSFPGGGRAVSDGDKLPGDVVCYPGHVGIYIGNNQIVHASTARTGIKVSNIYYRTPIGIRRYW